MSVQLINPQYIAFVPHLIWAKSKTFWSAPKDSELSSTFDEAGLTFKLYYVSVLDFQRQ